MSNGIVTKENFKEIKDTNIKLDILFETIMDMKEEMKNDHERIKKLEHKKVWDKATSFIGGLIGGAIAVLAKWFSGN